LAYQRSDVSKRLLSGAARITDRLVVCDLNAFPPRTRLGAVPGRHRPIGATRRREPPPLVVIRIELPQRRPRLPLAPEPQLRPRLLARLDARGHEDIERLGLLRRVDRLVADMRRIRGRARPCTPGSPGRARS
jgi:hypothetical protein